MSVDNTVRFIPEFLLIDLCAAAQKNNTNINLILDSLAALQVQNSIQKSVIKYIQTTPENTNLSILLNIIGLSNEQADNLLQQYSLWKNSGDSEIILPLPDGPSAGEIR